MEKILISTSPTGEEFPLPSRADYQAEFERLKTLAAEQSKSGKQIVVVVGLGFVGAVMAAVVADSTDKKGRSTKFVICVQRPSTRSYWKIPLLNRGVSPVKAEDPEVEELIKRCVKDNKTMVATYTEEDRRQTSSNMTLVATPLHATASARIRPVPGLRWSSFHPWVLIWTCLRIWTSCGSSKARPPKRSGDQDPSQNPRQLRLLIRGPAPRPGCRSQQCSALPFSTP